VLCYYDNDLPVFGNIRDVILQPNKEDTLLILTPYITEKYNRHFSAYEVKEVDGTSIYHQHELVDYHPLYLSKLFCVAITFICKE